MGFMKGRGALRRTIDWLQKGQIHLKNEVKIITFYYSPVKKFQHHQGLTNFVFWHIPQIQYHNPGVQLVTFKNMTPSPYILAYLDDERKVVIDCDSHTRTDIHEHVKKILGKSEEELHDDKQVKEVLYNPAIFGPDENRYCICSVPGQVPCSGFQPMPKERTGKYRLQMKQEGKL